MRRLAAALLLLVPLAGCSGGARDQADAPEKTLHVYAAASLQNAFTEIGKRFEDANDGVTVKFTFGGSSDLVAQIEQGAPADVFASADTANMDKAVKARVIGGVPQNFASNTLEIVTPPGNPAHIESLRDLTGRSAKVVVCAPEVPCGAAAARVEEAAGLRIKPVSEEQSVTDVLGKVISGEADAGLVYVTDVLGAGAKVHGVTFPESRQAVNTYPIASLRSTHDETLAAGFTDYVVGPEGQSVLSTYGFQKP
ncbi:molybdate-binding protein [Aeromicrobium sp. Root344]|uniref:molybdate ABC transporter substrate-binding protein n=1 Tax=Aeromicrobium sp. Root344 TaxID=1736521 RepID=UPI0006FC0450|nr:molybdate ABC transporter substrate-binding protein [Aeromicrobium sp. Root344]KQV75744.1 molybdate-binding protein [Aeromicrobium sp. Root344]